MVKVVAEVVVVVTTSNKACVVCGIRTLLPTWNKCSEVVGKVGGTMRVWRNEPSASQEP